MLCALEIYTYSISCSFQVVRIIIIIVKELKMSTATACVPLLRDVRSTTIIWFFCDTQFHIWSEETLLLLKMILCTMCISTASTHVPNQNWIFLFSCFLSFSVLLYRSWAFEIARMSFLRFRLMHIVYILRTVENERETI